MAKFLIDANLPYRFSLWHGPDYIHVFDLNDRWADWEIWDYAKMHGLTIATKDTDFTPKSYCRFSRSNRHHASSTQATDHA